MNLLFFEVQIIPGRHLKSFSILFVSWRIHFSFVCLTIFGGGLISEIYHFCPDVKLLFTVVAISRVQTEGALKL